MSYTQPYLRPPLGSNEVELERRRIENENMELTARLKSAILANRRRLNALAPISYLPPEVLSHIFRLLMDDEKPEYDVADDGYFFIRRSRKETELGWIGVTHVCGHWRRVAIEDCSLWRYLPLLWNIDWIQTFLLRCQSGPLSILYDCVHDALDLDWHSSLSSASIIRSMHDHLFHTRDLHIQGAPQILDSLFPGLIKAAPLLSSATFAVSRADSTQAKHVSRIPRQLFSGSAPNLRDLSLTNCVVPWDSSNLRHIVRNLTSLTIFFKFPHNDVLWSLEDPNTPISWHEALPSIAQLLDVLIAAPSLEFLILDGVLPSWSSQAHTSPQDTRVVSLPHLDTYQLTGNAYDCAAVSMHINAAPQTQLELECSFEGDEIEAELSAVAAALKNHISHCDHSSTFCSFIYLDTLGDNFLITTDSYVITLPLRSNTIISLMGFLRKCLALWPVSNPTRLRLHGVPSAFTKRDLIRIFDPETLHCVDRMVLEALNVRDFIDALREQTEFSDFRVLPGLQDITLKSLRLDKLALLSIHEVFALRKQSGRPIRKLRMDRCSRMSRFWSEKLQSDLGVELSCDGFTQEQSIP